jgi:hypothetical protein
MAKPQVAKSEPQKAPYVTPRILTFKVDTKLVSTARDPLGDLQDQGEQDTASQGLNRHRLRLLPRERLIKTSKFDHADWNFIPVLGFLQRKRFRLAVSLLPPKRLPRMLWDRHS